jgi:hypothetical protein
MNKRVYILGIVSLILIFVSAVFKINHFPGEGPLLVVGILSLSLVFYPTVYVKLLRSTNDKLLKLVYHTAFVSFFIDSVGALFKMMHWPGANWFLIIGVPLPFVIFLPAYLLYHHKRKLKTDSNFFGIFFFMIYMAVFSALLAVGLSYKVLNSFMQINAQTENANQAMVKGFGVSGDMKELLGIIDNVKKECSVWVDNQNHKAFEQEGGANHQLIRRKDISPTGYFYKSEMVNNAYAQFIMKYNQYMENTKGHSIAYIDQYIYNSEEKHLPILGQMPLTAVINTLTQFQNSLLLYELEHGRVAMDIK